MRLRIFNKVDLPAPLRPTIPTDSPRRTLNETSFRAHSSVGVAPAMRPGLAARRIFRAVRFTPFTSASRRLP